MEFLAIFADDGQGLIEGLESSVAADFTDGAEDAGGAELFEDVGIAEECALEGAW